jgi:hypothetical protein
MTRTKKDPAKPINGMESGQDSAAPAARRLEGQFLERRRRRRLDLKTIDGTLRESARLYRAMAQGELSLAAGDVMSRVLGRHGELLSALEQQELLMELNQKLEALRGGSALEQLAAPGGSA